MTLPLTSQILPEDGADAILVGRVWDPVSGGPRVVSVVGQEVFDLTEQFSTVSTLLDSPNPAAAVTARRSGPSWQLTDLVTASATQTTSLPHLLAPVDLQVVKACGVTFVESMVERVIEERCQGDPNLAQQVRKQISSALGGSLASLKPGSPAAAKTKEILIEQGMWSQYLEVGIGKDPEVFTKAPVLSSVGFGALIGIPRFSTWNNPEPELVLVVNSRGKMVGATLGNDVNLRDVEGRSALLLGMAKDNNGSSALGPFIRIFDDRFTVDSLRDEEIFLQVSGADGYELAGKNRLSKISRPFEELVNATFGSHHQYPDGFCLFTGTLFAPTQDRDTPGQGFTHKPGDTVRISSPQLGTLINTTERTEKLSPWTFGISELFSYLKEL